MTDLPCENCGLTEDTGCRCWEPAAERRWTRVFYGALVALWLLVLVGVVVLEAAR